MNEARSVVAWRRKGDDWVMLKVSESTLTQNVYELLMVVDAHRAMLDAMAQTLTRHEDNTRKLMDIVVQMSVALKA